MSLSLTELDYERIAETLDKLYTEKPELLFKLYNHLRKYFVTNDDFKQFMEQNAAQFRELIKQMDRRFEENRQETDKRFEENNKRFEDNRREVKKEFKRLDRRIDNVENALKQGFKELAIGYGGTFEGFNKTILRKILESRGIPVKALNVTPLHFEDPYKTIHPDSIDVEINIFNEEPAIVGEVTSSLTTLKKFELFVRKIQFLEEKFQKKFKRFFITLYVDEPIQGIIKQLAIQNAVEVITLE